MPQVKPKTLIKAGGKAAKSGVSVGLIISVIIFALLAILSAIGFSQSVRGKKYKKLDNVIYLVLFAIVISGLGAFALISKSAPVQLYWFLGVIMFGLGSLHVYFMYFLLAWSDRKTFWPEAFFTSYVGCLGAVGFILLSYFLDKQGYPMTYNWAIAFFFLPFGLVKAYDFWMNIPRKRYPAWRYPESRSPNSAYNPRNMRDKMDIGWILSEKDANNHLLKRLPLTVSRDYRVGEFFHYFIHEKRNTPGLNPIQHVVKHPDGGEIYWMFFLHRKGWWRKRIFVDPEKTFKENGIGPGNTNTLVGIRVAESTYRNKLSAHVKKQLKHIELGYIDRPESPNIQRRSSPSSYPPSNPPIRRRNPNSGGGGIRISKRK